MANPTYIIQLINTKTGKPEYLKLWNYVPDSIEIELSLNVDKSHQFETEDEAIWASEMLIGLFDCMDESNYEVNEVVAYG